MTENMYNTFIPDNTLAMQRQIVMFLRNAINSGKLQAGDKLPSSRKLAQVWGTNYFTVNSALKTLVQEGCLLQKPRVGTIVKKRIAKLEKVGIYFAGSEKRNRENYFYLVLQSKIQSQLAEHGAQCMVFYDERPEVEMGAPLTDLSEAISDGKIDCLIAPLINKTTLRWLNTLSVPRVALSSVQTPFTVTFDTEKTCRDIMERFVELQVKSVGAVTTVFEDYNCDGSLGFTGLLKKIARKYNIEFRDEWCIHPETSTFKFMEFGYTGYKRFNCLENRPEGLVLFPDLVAMGAVNSLMECRIKIPDDLKVILQENEQCEVFTPFKADRIVSEPAKVAQIMVDKLVQDTTGTEELKCSFYQSKFVKNY